MKVTLNQINAIVRVMIEIAHSDKRTVNKGYYLIRFLQRFEINYDKMYDILKSAHAMDKETAYGLIKGLDKSTKQELSDHIAGLILTDGFASDGETAILQEMISDCEIPIPGNSEWKSWTEETSDGEPLSDEKRILLWLKENDPADHGCLYRLDLQEFMSKDIACKIDPIFKHQYGVEIVDVKDILMYIIDHDEEHPYDLLIELGKMFRRSDNLEYAIYWIHKAALMCDKALEGILLEGIHLEDDMKMLTMIFNVKCDKDKCDEEKWIKDYFYVELRRVEKLGWKAYEELGYSFSSFSQYCKLKLPDLNKAIEAFDRSSPEIRAFEIGKAYMGLGDYASAENCFEKFWDIINPLDFPWYGYYERSKAYSDAWLGLLYYIRNNEEYAVRYWDQSIEGESGLGHYFKGRYLWSKKDFDSAIQIWQEGEKMFSKECSCELFQWIVGQPSTSEQRVEEEFNKILFNVGETKAKHKYIYRYVANGRCQTFAGYDSIDKANDELWAGVRNRCPYCLKILAEKGELTLSQNELNRIMKAWLYDGIEY